MNIDKQYNTTGYIWMAISFFAILISSSMFLYLESIFDSVQHLLISMNSSSINKQAAYDLIVIGIFYTKGFLIISLIMSLYTFGIQRLSKMILILSEYTSYINIIMLTALAVLLINSVALLFSPMKFTMEHYIIFIWLLRFAIGFIILTFISVYVIYLKFVYKIKNNTE